MKVGWHSGYVVSEGCVLGNDREDCYCCISCCCRCRKKVGWDWVILKAAEDMVAKVELGELPVYCETRQRERPDVVVRFCSYCQ